MVLLCILVSRSWSSWWLPSLTLDAALRRAKAKGVDMHVTADEGRFESKQLHVFQLLISKSLFRLCFHVVAAPDCYPRSSTSRRRDWCTLISDYPFQKWVIRFTKLWLEIMFSLQILGRPPANSSGHASSILILKVLFLICNSLIGTQTLLHVKWNVNLTSV